MKACISTTCTKKPQPAKRAAADYGQWNKAMFHPVSLNLFRHSAKGEFVVPDKKTAGDVKSPPVTSSPHFPGSILVTEGQPATLTPRSLHAHQ